MKKKIICLTLSLVMTLAPAASVWAGSVPADHSVDSGERGFPAEDSGDVQLLRLYNPNSGEHFYTGNAAERDWLILAGWQYEGIGWSAPAASSTPVYRIYNPNAGDHHYTKNAGEKALLVNAGWKDEGIGWYSDDKEEMPIYREYNPNAVTGTHNYTCSSAEHFSLTAIGWKDEGIGWYGIRSSRPNTPVTLYKGVDYSDVYDYDYYTAANPDIAKSYGGNDAQILRYYAEIGIRKGQKGKYNCDEVLMREKAWPEAAALIRKNGWMTLREVFDYAAGYRWIYFDVDPALGTHHYAQKGYEGREGNCYVDAGLFCELANALGYPAVQIGGKVPRRNGTFAEHSWVEINGIIYDPEYVWEYKKFGGYAVVPGTPGTLRYIKEVEMEP